MVFSARNKTHIVQDDPVPVVVKMGGVSVPEYRETAYHIVLSVDVGNTTTACVIVGTNLATGITYIVNKNVRMLHSIRQPREGENIYGRSIDGITLSKNAIEEHVRDIVRETLRESRLDCARDLDYVVHCTGLVARWESGGQIDSYLGSLARGCIEAGIPPTKMRPPMAKDRLPADDRQYSLMDRVIFDGAVAGTVPATGLSGAVPVANDMEGDLALAGMKQGALSTPVDFRNPCLGIDYGTILDGRITTRVTDDGETPYAKNSACIIGLGGAIADALTRGTGKVDPNTGNAREFFGDEIVTGFFSKKESRTIREYVDEVHDLITVEMVPHHRDHYGLVPIDPTIAEDHRIGILGVDVGENFSERDRLAEIGGEIYTQRGHKTFAAFIDRVMARSALRIIGLAGDRGLLPDDVAIGFSGRGIMSGRKPEYVVDGLVQSQAMPDAGDRVVFVSSALPRGAALMARCMAGLGNPKKPVGGCRGEPCILGRRRRVRAR